MTFPAQKRLASLWALFGVTYFVACMEPSAIALVGPASTARPTLVVCAVFALAGLVFLAYLLRVASYLASTVEVRPGALMERNWAGRERWVPIRLPVEVARTLPFVRIRGVWVRAPIFFVARCLCVLRIGGEEVCVNVSRRGQSATREDVDALVAVIQSALNGSSAPSGG